MAAATRSLNHRRSPPSADRFLGTFQPQSSAATPPLELSEHDIFSSPSGSSSPSNLDANPTISPTVDAQNHGQNNHGILAALNDSSKSRSGSSSMPVFNHKASASVSLSPSSSTSPSTSFSSRMLIPKRPPPAPSQVDRMRVYHQSAPVRVPVIPEALRKKVMEFEGVLLEEEEEEEVEGNGVILPPHQMVAARHSPILACSVMEGAGRTLKGRDLRQVRNAVWRQTGFSD
ncbi:protein TPRXL-like [Dorcoceras hygrometricum]|uniref:Protein TPRXL-like n=1 Tax=Dorcoceras hygrometricum TaxID=472368 RepID=A0A2Z7B7V8_9LAMI|nr:protein TPRXL-like [Dorcoceras hygrometricum]